MASSTTIFKTSAEEKEVNRKSTARKQAAWRNQSRNCLGHRQLPSFARLDSRGRLSLRGRGRVPVPTQTLVLTQTAVPTLAPLTTENRELRTGFMAALSPRAWLLRCVSGPGRRNCRVRVAGRG